MMDSGREEEEHHQNPFLSNNKGSPSSVPRPQFRKEVSKARWDEGMRMGEVIEKKGGIWGSTGIIRNGGKLYCSIEEILFLAERGALLLMDANETVLTLKDIYKKVADGSNGCCWDSFKAYRRLKSLGYIVGRHGVAWTLKSEKDCCSCQTDKSDIDGTQHSKEEKCKSITEQFTKMQISELKLTFDVYLPDSKFRKSSPGNPFFVLCMIRGNPPSREEVECLERVCKGIPLKFCHVGHWLVGNYVQTNNQVEAEALFTKCMAEVDLDPVENPGFGLGWQQWFIFT